MRAPPVYWVYPRVCGGTRRRMPPPGGKKGLSPRMRGNRADSIPVGAARGSIPAYAGEPGKLLPDGAVIAVYPRVCGGTLCRRPARPRLAGLSPRMRGNRSTGRSFRATLGSIPAYAGEPRCAGVGRWSKEVYPRVCGGTSNPDLAANSSAGLSPRMRGNRRRPDLA